MSVLHYWSITCGSSVKDVFCTWNRVIKVEWYIFSQFNSITNTKLNPQHMLCEEISVSERTV